MLGRESCSGTSESCSGTCPGVPGLGYATVQHTHGQGVFKPSDPSALKLQVFNYVSLLLGTFNTTNPMERMEQCPIGCALPRLHSQFLERKAPFYGRLQY